MNNRNIAIILAAGKGSRMNSSIPKPLHEVAGRPIIDHIIQNIMTPYEQVKDIQRAILAGLEFYQGVKLPSPQTAGTTTQKESYAFLKAKEVQEQIQ